MSFTGYFLAGLLAGGSPAPATPPVYLGPSGKLVYVPDSAGNTVPDYSTVGYRDGDEPIPDDVPVRRSLAPGADDRHTLQNAIAELEAMAPDARGFRGAILLQAGNYQLDSGVVIRKGGIVLRGAGEATVLHANGRFQHSLVAFLGTAGPVASGAKRLLPGAYIPFGGKVLTLSPGHGFQAGDDVLLQRYPKDAWIHYLHMDALHAADSTSADWTAGSYDYSYIRKVISVTGNEITLDASLVDGIDSNYATGYLVKYAWPGAITQVGIEDLRIESAYANDSDEAHMATGVEFDYVRDGWARRVSVAHMVYAAALAGPNSAFISVLDCRAESPKAIRTGGRMYDFCLDGQRCLFAGLRADDGRHVFVNGGSRVKGPNAFARCTCLVAGDASCHQRWSTGTLWDQVRVPLMQVINRWTMGSGHGWAGAQCMFWNGAADQIQLESPPGAVNWAVGCVSPKVGIYGADGYPAPIAPGRVESPGRPVAPASLYQAQWAERHGTTRAQAPRKAPREPAIVGLAGSTLRLRVPGSGPYRVSLHDAWGRVAFERSGRAGGGGIEQVTLPASLGSGHYLAEVEAAGRTSRESVRLVAGDRSRR